MRCLAVLSKRQKKDTNLVSPRSRWRRFTVQNARVNRPPAHTQFSSEVLPPRRPLLSSICLFVTRPGNAAQAHFHKCSHNSGPARTEGQPRSDTGAQALRHAAPIAAPPLCLLCFPLLLPLSLVPSMEIQFVMRSCNSNFSLHDGMAVAHITFLIKL